MIDRYRIEVYRARVGWWAYPLNAYSAVLGRIWRPTSRWAAWRAQRFFYHYRLRTKPVPVVRR